MAIIRDSMSKGLANKPLIFSRHGVPGAKGSMANQKHRVSVVVTSFNGADYIAKQLHSIAAQSSPPFEIIVSDDGSTDGTLAILQTLTASMPLKLFTRPTPLGINANVAFALQQCAGEFIAIADQDDIWEHEKIGILLESIGNFDAAFSNSVLIDAQDQSLHATLLDTYLKGRQPDIGRRVWRSLVKNAVSGHALLMHRRLLDTALPLSDELLYDHQLPIAAALGNGIRYVDQPLVRHRLHATNNVNIFNSDPREARPKKLRVKADRFLIALRAADQIARRIKGQSAAAMDLIKLLECIQRACFLDHVKVFRILLHYRSDLFFLYETKRHWRLALRMARGLVRAKNDRTNR